MLAEILPKLAAMEAEEDRPYYPRPSLASPEGEGKDERCLVYWGLGVPKSPMPGRAILTMDDSSWHEILTSDWINKSTYKLHSSQMAVEFKTEGLTIPSFFCKSCDKKIPKQEKLHGHIDGIITDMLGIDRLYEHKGINHFTFNNYWQGMMPIEYFVQVGIYHNALTEVIPDIKEVLLLIKNKNTAQFIEYLIGIEKDKFIIKEITHSNGDKKEPCTEFNGLIESAINKFKKVDEYIKKKTIPKRGYEINSWHCLTEDTFVKTINGWKEIKDIIISDKVLTIDGTYQNVVNVKKTFNTKKQIYTIKPYQLLPISLTEDHKILVESKRLGNMTYKIETKTQWLPVQQLIDTYQKYRMLYRIDNRVDPAILLDRAELTILGLFIAEGCLANIQYNRYYRVEFTFNEKERILVEILRNAIRKKFNLKIKQFIRTDKRNGRRTLKAIINSKEVVDFISQHINCEKAHKKSFKEHIMLLPFKKQQYLLDIMIKGDGCRIMTKKAPTVIYSTASKKLALQVQDIYLRNNKITGIAFNKPNRHQPNAFINNKGCYHVRYYPKASRNLGLIEDGFLKVPILSIKKTDSERDVYDISVGYNHNFQTNAGIVHNCEYCQYYEHCYQNYKEEFEALTVDAVLEGEIIDLAKYYLETNMHLREMEKEKDELNKKIKGILEGKGIKEGRAGDYIIKNQLIERKSIDSEKIPIEVFDRYSKKVTYTQLRINKAKQGG